MAKILELHCFDILNHPEFLKLKTQEHHYTSTVYDHSVRVGETASRICMKLHLPPTMSREIVRAALLHDFYDFDRKKRREYRDNTYLPRLKRIRSCFLFVHPKSAAYHAKEVFDINERQIHAIRSHMFPLAPFPTNIDGWIVTASDKYVTIKECYEAFRKKDVFSWKEFEL